MKITILALTLLSSFGLMAQIESNEYFEVLGVAENPVGRFRYFDLGYFALNVKEEDRKATFLDTLGNKIDVPCDRFSVEGTMGQDLIYCHHDSLIGVFSFSKNELITPIVDSIQLINQDFYSIQKDGHLLLYNKDHKLLYDAKTNEQLKNFYQYCDKEHVIIYEKNEKHINYSGELVEDYGCLRNKQTFSDGTYVFSSNKKLGVKSESGQVLIPAKYEHIEEWRGKYVVSIRVLNTNKTGFRSKYKDLKGIIDKQGNTILPLEYDYINTYPYGLVGRKPDCKNVFLSESFENIYNKEFESIRASANGFILFTDENDTYYDLAYDSQNTVLQNGIESGKGITNHITELKFENGQHILVDRTGKIIFEPKEKVLQFKKFNNHYIEVKFANSVGLMKEDGEWLIEPGDYKFKSYKELKGFILYDKVRNSNSNTLYNSKGKSIAQNIQTASLLDPLHAYVISKQNKVGVIDDQGKILIPFQYERVYELRSNSEYYQIADNNLLHLVKLRK